MEYKELLKRDRKELLQYCAKRNISVGSTTSKDVMVKLIVADSLKPNSNKRKQPDATSHTLTRAEFFRMHRPNAIALGFSEKDAQDRELEHRWNLYLTCQSKKLKQDVKEKEEEEEDDDDDDEDDEDDDDDDDDEDDEEEEEKEEEDEEDEEDEDEDDDDEERTENNEVKEINNACNEAKKGKEIHESGEYFYEE